MTEQRLEVLVVDDDEDTRAIVCRAVRDLGHGCSVAADGSSALDQLAARHADVVISDWEMPGMNGAELCRITRSTAADERPYTYFILLTGYADREHLIEGMHAGADDFQKKPVDLDELEARLVSAGRVVALHKRLARRNEDLRRDSRRLYVASRTDPLTGVGNRAALDDELESIRARFERYGQRCSIAIADVDLFKSYNDTFGHVAGDDVLRRVTDAIRRTIRTSDGLFRYGGEEFVVVLPAQSIGEATSAMERVRSEVERLAIPAKTGLLTVSLGVAELEAGDRTVARWVERADAALYEAKAAGRNRVGRAA